MVYATFDPFAGIAGAPTAPIRISTGVRAQPALPVPPSPPGMPPVPPAPGPEIPPPKPVPEKPATSRLA